MATAAVLLVSACGSESLATGGGASATLAWPEMVAHRGGTADAPENTLPAIRSALDHGADMIWLTVQLSLDQVPVLYRPADLSAWTESSGMVAQRTVAQLQQLNAGWNFKRTDAAGVVSYPYRTQPMPIPTLREALRVIPPGVPVVLDMKALPALPQARAVAAVLDEEGAWNRVWIYSTEAAYQEAFATIPNARIFESRDATRQRLLDTALAGKCNAPAASSGASWAGFELFRDLTVVEKFTLGEGVSKVRARMWSPAAVGCYRKDPGARVLAFGVNSADDYRAAACMGVDAVLVDSPVAMSALRASEPQPWCRAANDPQSSAARPVATQ